MCEQCFKNIVDPASCIDCRYNQAAEALQSIEYLLNPSELEEARFELYSKFENKDRGEKEIMSDLMSFVGKCGEPAINLAKKR